MRPLRLALAVLLPGCGGSAPRSVSAVESRAVAHCKYLEMVYGSSGWTGAFAQRGLREAREQAMARAAAVGASHIVWSPQGMRPGTTDAAAQAYLCR